MSFRPLIYSYEASESECIKDTNYPHSGLLSFRSNMILRSIRRLVELPA